MKKLVKGLFVLALFILIMMETKVYAATPTLEQIADTFNNCKMVKECAAHGSIWTASCNNNKLIISLTVSNTTKELEYTLEGSILKANFSTDELQFGALIVNMYLTDSIGQLHGYSDGELITTLNLDKISNYSVENEGYELKKLSDESYQIKIDISKKIPLIDMSNVYIEVSDLNSKFISGDGGVTLSKGNILLYKSGYNGENTVCVAEKGELTENTYKSILSTIEVMFGSNKATEYFKSNYSGISVGNKEFTGFKVEVNPAEHSFEEDTILSDEDYKFIRITIDKNLANSAINGTNSITDDNEDKVTDTSTDKNEEQNQQQNPSDALNYTQNTIKEDKTTAKTGKLPQTGVSMTIVLVMILVTIIATVFYKQYSNYKDIK